MLLPSWIVYSLSCYNHKQVPVWSLPSSLALNGFHQCEGLFLPRGRALQSMLTFMSLLSAHFFRLQVSLAVRKGAWIEQQCVAILLSLQGLGVCQGNRLREVTLQECMNLCLSKSVPWMTVKEKGSWGQVDEEKDTFGSPLHTMDIPHKPRKFSPDSCSYCFWVRGCIFIQGGTSLKRVPAHVTQRGWQKEMTALVSRFL